MDAGKGRRHCQWLRLEPVETIEDRRMEAGPSGLMANAQHGAQRPGRFPQERCPSGDEHDPGRRMGTLQQGCPEDASATCNGDRPGPEFIHALRIDQRSCA